MLSVVPGVFAAHVGTGIPVDIVTEDFAPQVWQCDHRIVLDDTVEPGTTDGAKLVEREQNYAFEGESIQWTVLVMDKNGINKVEDVYGKLDDDKEVNCVEDLKTTRILEDCNARILEEKIKEFNPTIMRYYTCKLTVETQDSMSGEHYLTVEAMDLDGLTGVMAEQEYWFFNPVVALSIDGALTFEDVRPGTSSYSEPVLVGNDAEDGSGVRLNMFIAGTNFYDTSSSGAMCPSSNVLELKNFRYYATNGYYSTKNVGGVGPYAADAEGYMPIPNGERIDQAKEIIGTENYSPSLVSSVGNTLTPGSEMSLVFRLNLPEPCNGDFDSGQLYFWGEAI
jgi:hypothetical protein